MNKFKILSLVFLLFALPSRADIFDWIPVPKISFKDVGDFFSDIWDDINDAVLEPIVNFSSDGLDFLGDQLVGFGLAPDIKVLMKKIVESHLKDPYGIVLTNSDMSDDKWSLTVISDPTTNLVLFQDNKNKSSIEVPGLGSKTIPSMGIFDAGDSRFRLSGPKGLTTDHRGVFWVADTRNHRIVSFKYDHLSKSMVFLGSVGHYSRPSGVSHSPGQSYSGSDDLLYVANTDANSLCRVPANMLGEGVWEDIPGAVCFEGSNSVIFLSITAVAVENNSQAGSQGDSRTIYVAYDRNKVARVVDDGEAFEILGTMEVGAVGTAEITGLATDAQGFLYVMDNMGGKVEYYATDGAGFQKIHSFGVIGTGSSANTIQFNNPRMLALFKNELFVTEAWGGNSGIQRFKAVPTIDRNITSIQVIGPVSNPMMELTLKVSSTAKVEFQLEYIPDPVNLANRYTAYQLAPAQFGEAIAGTNVFQFPFRGNTGGFDGVPLTPGGLYRVKIKVFVPSDLANHTDEFSNELVLGRTSLVANVDMKENGLGEPNISKPQVRLTNLSSSETLQNFTIRLWLSTEEVPTQEIVVDRYYTDPGEVAISFGRHPSNPNLAFIDFKYPSTFSLSPGQATSETGLQVGTHFRNYYPGEWNRNNDFSWQGITESFGSTQFVNVFDTDGRIIHGKWPDVFGVPSPPAIETGDVFGFETLHNWGSTQAGVTLSSSKTQGNSSLSVDGSGYVVVSSSPLKTQEISNETANLRLDVLIPGNQPNPYWVGSAEMYIDCFTANIYSVYLGHAELTGLPQNQFSSLEFSVPSNVLTALQGEFSDFTVKIILNSSSGAPPFLLDSLRFTP